MMNSKDSYETFQGQEFFRTLSMKDEHDYELVGSDFCEGKGQSKVSYSRNQVCFFFIYREVNSDCSLVRLRFKSEK